MKKITSYFFIVFIFFSCEEEQPMNLIGLWKVEKLVLDGFDRTEENQIYLQFNDKGDFSSIGKNHEAIGSWNYLSNTKKLAFSSGNEIQYWRDWYNFNWSLQKLTQDKFRLSGKRRLSRVTNIIFKKVDRINLSDDLFEKIIGKWNIYKIKTNTVSNNIENSWISFSKNKEYVISKDDQQTDLGNFNLDFWKSEIELKGQTNSKWKISFVEEKVRMYNLEEGMVLFLSK